MNYEKLILDLYERVLSLEETVSNLQNQLGNKVTSVNNEEEPSVGVDKKITRNISRNYVMEKLAAENPDFIITKGNRAANADILLETRENEITYTLKAKFYHSKSFHRYPSGWHTVHKDDLVNEDLDLFIFNVEFEGSFYPFLLSRQELLLFVKDKTTDQNDTYHFYFHIIKDKVMEVRDQEKDASAYYSHWKLPSEIMKKGFTE